MRCPLTITRVGDATLLASFENRIDPDVNARAVSLGAAIRSARVPGVRDVIVTYRSVAVCFEPGRVEVDALADLLRASATSPTSGQSAVPPVVEIPVRYGGADGPDLADVARFASCREDEVVRRHTAITYRVYMLGFMPGFGYMASIDERIAMPRKAMPRVRVPAGSVGIAGRQTGVYPNESPGGWQIIGRTSVRLFSLEQEPPALLQAGMRVRFVAVDAADRSVGDPGR